MAKKETAGRKKGILALSLLFGPAFLLALIGLISNKSCEHKFKQPDDYGEAINYTFTDARGKKFTSKDFKDNVVVVTTLQPKCPDSCAISFWHLDQHIFQNVRKNKKKLGSVRIISFVTDGEGNPMQDVSQVYAMVRDQVEEYDPEIWMIASGSSKELYNFENNGQRLLQEGDEFYGGQAFQELMLLLDKRNHLRMVLSGKSEGMLRRMKEHVALLQKEYDKQEKKRLNEGS